jgi:NADH-quinone oxidoreductase subunit M
MFLAGISMKLGGYGCLRVATYLMPKQRMNIRG